MLIALNELLKAKQEVAQAVANLYGAEYEEDRGSLERLSAIAADVIMPWIENDVETELITDLLLERQSPQKGDVRWPKKPLHKAWYLDEEGELQSTRDKKAFISPEGWFLGSEIELNRLDLERGYLAPLEDQVAAVKDDIVSKLNSKAIELLVAAVQAAMTVNTATLTSAAFNQAFDMILDQRGGLKPELIVLRATLGTTIKGWTNPQTVAADLMLKGLQAITMDGANILYAPDMAVDQVLIVANKKPGRILDEFEFTQDEIEKKGKSIKIPVWQVFKMAVTNANRFALINITG